MMDIFEKHHQTVRLADQLPEPKQDILPGLTCFGDLITETIRLSRKPALS
jgi:hypothetical protein